MLAALARFVVRRRKSVLVATLVFVVFAGAFGGSVAESLTSGGFDDPNAEAVVREFFARYLKPNGYGR